MKSDHCECVEIVSDERIRRAFTERKPISGGPVQMSEPWKDIVSPEGRPAVEAKFFCDLCGRTHSVVVEISGEPDPSDWWKV